MEKQMLRCDICGGDLEMQGGGKAVCTSCGMKYSTDSLHEKLNGLKVSVTGSKEDVEQWKQLVKTYVNQQDYSAAEVTIKKILEAAPSDEYANNMYSLLQEWKYLEVVNGTLIRYSGRSFDVNLPDGIQIIGESAFKKSKIHSITLPQTLVNIEDQAFEGCPNLRSVILPKSVIQIGDYAFRECSSLETIDLSNVESIGSGCFWGCQALRQVELPRDIQCIPDSLFAGTALVQITIPPEVKSIGAHAFQNCPLQDMHLPDGLERIDLGAFSLCRALKHVSIPSTVKTLGGEAFVGCSKLAKIDASQMLVDQLYRDYCMRDTECLVHEPLEGTPWWDSYINQKKRENCRNRNVCQYCGGEFKGMFTKVCSRCGKPKDY